MTTIQQAIYAFVHDESGQDLIEYAIIAGLIGLAGIASMNKVSTAIKNAFTSISTALTSDV